MTETDIMHLIQIALSKHGIVFRLNVGSFMTTDGRYISSGLPVGTSDLLFIGRGYIAFIEVKRPGGHIRPEQINFINTMRQMGHRAGIARSVEDAIQIINYAGNPADMEGL